MRTVFILLVILTSMALSAGIDLYKAAEYDIGHAIGQCRAIPVETGEKKHILLIHSKDAEIDPYIGMFFFPQSTTILTLISSQGVKIWERDLGPGMVSGIWFLPVFSFDLDQDGNDEIWLVNNSDPDHPLDFRKYVLQRLDGITGKIIGEYPWPKVPEKQSMSHTYRNFILGGYVKDEPVLVTAQGTYGPMQLQGWNTDMSQRWEVHIAADEPGASGSHVCPIVDINNDSIDEFMWGERCISMNHGQELFCADKETWHGHSDIVMPVLERESKKWTLHTCREQNVNEPPRIVVYDNNGERRWSALDRGHIDTGWAAHIGPEGEPIVLGVRVGKKIRTAEGERRTGIEPFTFHAFTGEPYPLDFNAYTTIPVDLNGDGIHELVKGYFEGDGSVLDRNGNNLGNIGGLAAMACKFIDHPGEQILSYSHETGTVCIWADRNADDSKIAKERYRNPFYDVNKRLTACGYNLFNLGGL